jgi:hypothetical protein
MSAYGIGADTARVKGGVRMNEADTNVPATIVKWIPGEAITFYAAILGIGAAQSVLTGNETPQELLERIEAGSFGWFATGVAVAIALVITGALTAPRDAGTRVSLLALLIRILLALVAFALWTSALPGSWTYSLNMIRDLGAAYGLLLVPLGLVFATLAEWLTRKIQL